MLLASWLYDLRRRLQQPVRRRRRLRGRPRAILIAADVQQLETRILLSSVLVDTTPVTTIKATAGTSTGNVVLATFSDGNSSAVVTDFTPTVNWGGLLTAAPTVSVQVLSPSLGTWEVMGNATYAAQGLNLVGVSIVDANGNTVQTSSVSIDVFGVSETTLTDTTPVTTLKATAGASTGTVVLATFTDNIPAGGLQTSLGNQAAPQQADFTPNVISWGGPVTGTSSKAVQFISQSATGSTWEVVGSAIYANAGNYRPIVTVTDKLGNTIQTSNVTVNVQPAPTAAPTGLSPNQIRNAYGFNTISFQNAMPGDGTGQTIAIIEAYNQTGITSDVQAFDQHFGLTGFNGVGQPTLTFVAGTAGAAVGAKPTADSTPWGFETRMDVEWVHAMAQGANIVVVQAVSDSVSDLLNAVDTARKLPGVSVVSMSFGWSEASSETANDQYFTTPANHAGVTFVAAAGDSGTPTYPATSPNVLAVAGTTFNAPLDANGDYVAETAWNTGAKASGGGLSQFEPQPGYQQTTLPGTANRATPDVSFDAGGANGSVSVYDSLDYGDSTPWIVGDGTSLAATGWTSLIAIADQGSSALGHGTLDGARVLSSLYSIANQAGSVLPFHDVTSGNNSITQGSNQQTGNSAGIGYDLATGLGTPNAAFIAEGLSGNIATPAIINPVSGLYHDSAPPIFHWSAVSGALDYQLIITDQATHTVVFDGNIAGATASGGGGFAYGVPALNYSWTIQADTTLGVSGPASNPLVFSAIHDLNGGVNTGTGLPPKAPVPTPPGTTLPRGAPTLSWSPSQSGSSLGTGVIYSVSLKQLPNGNPIVLPNMTNITATSFLIPLTNIKTAPNSASPNDLIVGDTYEWSVSATDAQNTSVNNPVVDFVLNVPPPTLTTVNTLTGGNPLSPVSITYSQLQQASNANDPDGYPIEFQITPGTSGTLTINHGGGTTAGGLFGPGDTLTYTPAAGTGGASVQAFSVTATNSISSSSTPVPVMVNVAAVALSETTPAKTLNAFAGTATGNIVLATFADQNALPTASEFTATVTNNWGGPITAATNPTVQLVSQSGGTSYWEVIGDATYSSRGQYAVSVNVIDSDAPGIVQTSKTTINVSNAAAPPAFEFSGWYAVSTPGSNSPTLASIVQGGDQLTLTPGGASATLGAFVTNAPQVLAGLPQVLIGNTVVGTYGNSSISFTTGAFAGQVWTKLDLPLDYTNLAGDDAQIKEDGATLTFSVGSAFDPRGAWKSPTQVSAFGQIGTVGNGMITWSGGNVWTENLGINGSIRPAGASANSTGTATISASLNSFVTNYTNLNGFAAHVFQTGTSLTLVVDPSGTFIGATSPGFWIDTTHVSAFGQIGTVGATGSITWSFGQVWTVLSSPPLPATTNYTNLGGAATHIVQKGVLLTFVVNSSGDSSPGYWINPTQVYAPAFGQTGTVGNGKITWSGGNVWAASSTIVSPPSFSNYTNKGGAATQVVQNGTSLTFVVDDSGESSPGYWISPTQVYAPAFGQTGTVSGNKITWSGGNVWSGMTNLRPSTSVLIALTDTNGVVSYVQLTSATTLKAVDGALAGLTATRQNNQIVWSNGDVWNNFDFNALNALFEMATGYP